MFLFLDHLSEQRANTTNFFPGLDLLNLSSRQAAEFPGISMQGLSN